jgi:hypothetical protein
MTEAHLPYAGTSGWSGTQTSRQRAETEDSIGTTAKRQREVLHYIVDAGVTGRTVRDVRRALSLHHGQASSALTLLHKAGAIARLSEVRDRCKVYVVPELVVGRETEAVASRHARTREFYPRRGDKVEAWLKECRDQHANMDTTWFALDALLDQYRLDADTGSELGKGREG